MFRVFSQAVWQKLRHSAELTNENQNQTMICANWQKGGLENPWHCDINKAQIARAMGGC